MKSEEAAKPLSVIIDEEVKKKGKVVLDKKNKTATFDLNFFAWCMVDLQSSEATIDNDREAVRQKIETLANKLETYRRSILPRNRRDFWGELRPLDDAIEELKILSSPQADRRGER